jgi:xylulokinase
MLLACGTAWVVTGVMDRLALARVPTALDWNFHALDDRYTISQSLGGLGAAMEWWLNQAYRGLFGSELREEMYATLDAELMRTRPDNHLTFLPLTGGHNDRGAQQRGGFVGLQLGHSRADMARAVMESAAFELRWLLEPVQQAGLPVERLWMIGGAAQSYLWPQILADATGIPISLPQYDTWPALGAAVLAGMGIGVFGSAGEGLTRFQKPERDIAPDAAMQEQYEEMFERYQQVS